MFVSPYDIVRRLINLKMMKSLNSKKAEKITGGGVCQYLAYATWYDVPSWVVKGINWTGSKLKCW